MMPTEQQRMVVRILHLVSQGCEKCTCHWLRKPSGCHRLL